MQPLGCVSRLNNDYYAEQTWPTLSNEDCCYMYKATMKLVAMLGLVPSSHEMEMMEKAFLCKQE